MSFVVGSPSKPASGAVAEMLQQIIMSNLRRIGDAFDQALATGVSSDLATTHVAVLVDARTQSGREFLCHTGFHGPWGKTDFPVVILPRLDLSLLMEGAIDNVLRVPPEAGRILVVAIGAGSEADSTGIAIMQPRYGLRPPLGEQMADKEDEVSFFEGEERVKHLDKIKTATELAVRRVAELNALDPSPRHLLPDETSKGLTEDADTVMGDARRNEHGDPEGAAVWLRLHEVVAEYVRAVRRHERAAS